MNKLKDIKIDVDTTDLDKAIEKVDLLISKLKEVEEISKSIEG